MSTRKGIGYSPLTESVYLGRQNREKGLWIGDKEDITKDFINVALQWLGDNEAREIHGDQGSENILINCVNDKESIEKVIRHLQKRISEDKDNSEESTAGDKIYKGKEVMVRATVMEDYKGNGVAEVKLKNIDVEATVHLNDLQTHDLKPYVSWEQ